MHIKTKTGRHRIPLPISEDQYLSLIAMLIAPTNYNPRTHPKENAERVESLKLIVIGRCRQ